MIVKPLSKTPLTTALRSGQRLQPAVPGSGPRRYSISMIGEAKCGKTEFGCTCPKPLFLQWDPNHDNVKSWGHPYLDFAGMPAEQAIRQFLDVEMPALYNREYDCETIVIDSWNFFAMALQATIPVPKTKQGADDIWPHFRALKREQVDLVPRITSITEPFPGDPGRRTYNLVITYHMVPELVDVMNERQEKVGTRISRWVPDIEGGFKEKLQRITGCVFWAEKERLEDGTVHHFMWTKDPDRLRHADDSVGGKGGYNRLPLKIPNTWDSLMEGWGIAPEKD